ncbi:MAG: HGGxSTG domain-containing protein [Proteobacteria bacterium]|nr:HGGxSTG domain-containing protein [Pseudomonadota bacterium]
MEEKRQSGEPITPKSKRPRCGAKTRAGGRCMAPVVWDRQADVARNGRCRMHGGLSTGPRTEEGLRRTLEAMRAGRARWLAARSKV